MQFFTRILILWFFICIDFVKMKRILFRRDLDDSFADTTFDSMLLPEFDLFATNDLNQLSQNSDVNLFNEEPLGPTTLPIDFDWLSNNNEQNEPIDTTLGASLADDIFCVGSDFDTFQSFDKRRRGNVCQDPNAKSGSEGQGSEKPPEPFNLEQFLDNPLQIGTFFKNSEGLCPTRIFLTSTIPVCVFPQAVIQTYFPNTYVDILNVYPLLPGNIGCPLNWGIWCCSMIVETRVRPDVVFPLTSADLQGVYGGGPDAIPISALLRAYILEGKVCYPQRLKDTEVPMLEMPNRP